MARNSYTNITDSRWEKALKDGISDIQASNLWRELVHQIQPEKDLRFESDRYELDGRVGAILTITIKEGSNYKLPKAWGVNLIPDVSDPKVSVSLITSVNAVPEKEVIDKVTEATKSAKGSIEEAEDSGQLADATAAEQLASDMDDIASEIKSGSYMHLSIRLNVIADDEEALQQALQEIEIGYSNYFSKISLEQFIGEQQKDYRNFFAAPRNQLGYNYKMTSQELGGMAPFITRGLEDINGVFVGKLTADVNSGAIMLDTQKFDRLALVGARQEAVINGRRYYGISKSSLWGVQYAQDALMRGHKVHQLILNNAEPLKFGGVDLSSITTEINMAKGSINIFEVFGRHEEELQLFAVQIEKLKLIVKQLNPDLTESELQLFGEVIQQFYVDAGLWVPNAKNHRDELRLVGIPSSQVPKFARVADYFKKGLLESRSGMAKAKYDESDEKALKQLERLFAELFDKYGDVFGKQTNLDTKRIQRSLQSIYTFKGMERGSKGVFMSQVINALSYLGGNVNRGDLVIIHGAERIDDSMYDYFKQQVEYYWSQGVKVVLLYDTPKAMLDSKMYDDAGSVMIGPSTKSEMDLFDQKFDAPLPATVRNELSNSGREDVYYFKRQMESALFEWRASL